MSTLSWASSPAASNVSEYYYWDWGTAPQSIAISTTATTVLSASNQPRLVSYRVDADPAIKLKIWKNAATTGPHELDSYGGHNLEQWELNSALKVATVSGTANIIVNVATKVII